MREIKFRAWNKTTRGILDWHYVKVVPLQDLINQPHIELMQYTGLKDKNGVEIYEGDIVKGYDDTAVIKFDDSPQDGGRYYPDFNEGTGKGWDWWGDKERWYYLEVIGNIYENPELLEGSIQTARAGV